MNDLHLIQPDGSVELAQRLVKASLAHHVVVRNVRVTRVDAGRDRHDTAQPIQDFRDLLECTAE